VLGLADGHELKLSRSQNRWDVTGTSSFANPRPTDAMAIKGSESSRQAKSKMQAGWLPEHPNGVHAAFN
jgi:hypothetical protein